MSTAIRCEGLTKRFGDTIALNGVDLEVPAGVIFGFLGPNGAGKTTTIRLLTGLDRATAGRATVLGQDVRSADRSLRHRIAYLDQQPQFYGWMTGRETLEFVGGLFELKGRVLSSRVDQVLEDTGLSSAAKRRVGGYSGGMKQRLGIAQALINEPELLFLDEPASALDPAGRRDILDIIAGLRGRATVFMSTHILADVERVCDRVGIINGGEIVVESSLAELQARHARPVFILEPEPRHEEEVSNLVQAIGEQPWCASISHEHGEIRVQASDTRVAGLEIMSLAAKTGTALARFQRDRLSIEDIFLQIVGEDDPVHSVVGS